VHDLSCAFGISRETVILSLQHTATHCNTLQHTATHCNTILHTTTHYSTLQHAATYCNTLQHAATHCNTLSFISLTESPLTTVTCHGTQHTCDMSHVHESPHTCGMSLETVAATRCNMLQHAATCCDTLQHAATRCNIRHTCEQSINRPRAVGMSCKTRH